MNVLSQKYDCIDDHPKDCKDVNEELIHKSLLLSTDL